MKRTLLLLGCLISGAVTGGGAALAVGAFVTPSPAPAVAESGPLRFVKVGSVLAPLVFEDGQLAGYASFELQLHVPEDAAEDVTARIPLLLHALNLQTYRTPLAAGPGGQLPDLAAFRRLVARSSDSVFGRGTVRQVAITNARPA